MSNGQLGDGTKVNSSTPITILSSGVKQVSTGIGHTCIVTTTGGAMCWGLNTEGQLGDGTVIENRTPGPVQGLTSGVVSIHASRHSTCAILLGNKVKCWGEDRNVLKNGPDLAVVTGKSLVPVDFDKEIKYGALVSAPLSTKQCFTTIDNYIKCRGTNVYGELPLDSRAVSVPLRYLVGP